MVNWRVYYEDGFMVNNEEISPWELATERPNGVLGINQRHQDPSERPYHVWQSDYYIWLHDRWVGVDYIGVTKYLYFTRTTSLKAALAGEMVTNEQWDDFVTRIKSDPDFF
jgi:hypothetical protein